VVWLIVTVVGTSVLAVMRRAPPGTFRDVGATFIIVFYLGFLGSFGLHLRCGPGAAEQQGVWLLLIVILATKASDIGGFFVGSTFGRHKLIPKVSPGKSVEGTIGGIVASVLFMMLVASGPSLAEALGLSHETRGMVERITRSFSTEHESGILSPVWRAFFFGLAMALTGQLGDLIESCFKRDAGSKDSGEIIPRFGGILDLVDSPVLAMPAAWFLLVVVWGVAK
jgi:phosphatidate cytidylyltransferase